MNDPNSLILDDHDGGDRAKLTDTLTLAWLVDVDGERWPLIVDTTIMNTAESRLPYGQRIVELAPHENLGKLPADYRDRLDMLCGAPTSTTKRPCRNPVRRPGDRCQWHAKMAHTEATADDELSCRRDDLALLLDFYASTGGRPINRKDVMLATAGNNPTLRSAFASAAAVAYDRGYIQKVGEWKAVITPAGQAWLNTYRRTDERAS